MRDAAFWVVAALMVAGALMALAGAVLGRPRERCIRCGSRRTEAMKKHARDTTWRCKACNVWWSVDRVR